MKITIVGAGNVGTQFAVHCAEQKHHVYMYTSKADRIQTSLIIVNEEDSVIHKGQICVATDNPEEAFSQVDLIFVTVPSFFMDVIADKILPYAQTGMKICLVPGTGGGEWAFRDCINKGAVLFGLQRVPSVARLVEYGHIVRATVYRDELFVASLPGRYVEECAGLISSIFDMQCSPMPNYLNLTLTPSNPILHTTRLRILFGDYTGGKVYDRVPLFYEEWSDATSELLFKCDYEVQEICSALSQFDLSFVKSLKDHYESYTPKTLTEKIRNIRGFKGLTSPTVKVEGGYIPDLDSRYFTADFPYGLAILVQIADMLSLDVPHMKETLAWYDSLNNKAKRFSFKAYKVANRDDLVSFYSL